VLHKPPHCYASTLARRRNEGVNVKTHHLSEKYHEAFPEGTSRAPITFFTNVLLETAEGIANIASLVSKILVVYNGDILTSCRGAFVKEHGEARTLTLVLRSTGLPCTSRGRDQGASLIPGKLRRPQPRVPIHGHLRGKPGIPAASDPGN